MHKMMRFHLFSNAIESNAIKNNELTVELQEWLIWAKDKSERFDPIGL